MKNFLKKVATTLLVGGLFFSAASLGACSKVPDEPKDDGPKQEQVLPEGPNENPGKDPVTPPVDNPPVDNPPVVDKNKQKLQEAAGKVLAVLDEAKKSLNFHYAEDEADFYAQTLTDGFSLKYSVGGVDTYFVGKSDPDTGGYKDVFKIYQNAESEWVGEPATEELVSENPLALYDAVWTEFEDGKLIGKMGEKDVSATVDDDLTGISWTVDGVEHSLNQIGEVNVEVPEYTDLTAVEYVYQTVNGQREYNIPVLAKALEEAIIEGDLLTKINFNVNCKLFKITHIRHNENLQFGACYLLGNTKIFRIYNIDENNLTANEMTFNDLKNKLKNGNIISSKEQAVAYEASTLENDEEFKTMADNVLKKLAQDGCQGDSIKNKAEGFGEFENANILFGYKTKNSSNSYGGDLGLESASEYMLLIKKAKGETEELNLKVGVAYSQYGQNYNLLNLDTSKVLVIKFEREEIDKENAKLYENSSNIKLNTTVTPYIETKRN